MGFWLMICSSISAPRARMSERSSYTYIYFGKTRTAAAFKVVDKPNPLLDLRRVLQKGDRREVAVEHVGLHRHEGLRKAGQKLAEPVDVFKRKRTDMEVVPTKKIQKSR